MVVVVVMGIDVVVVTIEVVEMETVVEPVVEPALALMRSAAYGGIGSNLSIHENDKWTLPSRRWRRLWRKCGQQRSRALRTHLRH